MSLIEHTATRAGWERARRDGGYPRPTAGKTLAEGGFIHASQAGLANMFYRDPPDDLLVLLIDTDAVLAARPLLTGPGGEFAFIPDHMAL